MHARRLGRVRGDATLPRQDLTIRVNPDGVETGVSSVTIGRLSRWTWRPRTSAGRSFRWACLTDGAVLDVVMG